MAGRHRGDHPGGQPRRTARRADGPHRRRDGPPDRLRLLRRVRGRPRAARADHQGLLRPVAGVHRHHQRAHPDPPAGGRHRGGTLQPRVPVAAADHGARHRRRCAVPVLGDRRRPAGVLLAARRPPGRRSGPVRADHLLHRREAPVLRAGDHPDGEHGQPGRPRHRDRPPTGRGPAGGRPGGHRGRRPARRPRGAAACRREPQRTPAGRPPGRRAVRHRRVARHHAALHRRHRRLRRPAAGLGR